MTLLLIGYLAWPLQFATISTEGTDMIDGFSRSFAYFYQRPAHFLFYTFVATIFGAVCIFVVGFVTSLMVYLGKNSLELVPWGYTYRDADVISAQMIYAPTSYEWQQLLLDGKDVSKLDQAYPYVRVGAGIVSFWLHLVFFMMLGFGYSYFWSSNTVVYFLLRKSLDNTEMDEVYIEEEMPERFPKPAATPPPAAAPSTPAGPSTVSSTLPIADGPRPSEPPAPSAN
jgi:hypothetical protein